LKRLTDDKTAADIFLNIINGCFISSRKNEKNNMQDHASASVGLFLSVGEKKQVQLSMKRMIPPVLIIL